ncbi:fumarate reductase subunit A [Methanoculleus sp. YWC-01]|jgi:fumarate reductase (CoM/CoB) subunit A|uniref:Fumarate reductase subunit A n=1 Tax=Methanoculleus nereidis TaxID=2735141 RepID=A0ABU3YZH9_9EURY|nr:fumarate reductase (CoM/CoB) subunit TfrA [Methanoculleus sp. YWC-01]MCK9298328.1 fumarate reductase subunit A [Methanoculleus sp.]MDV4341970.1 fumarate reductase subunit A [Methanoculleus sp. YWC-01]
MLVDEIVDAHVLVIGSGGAGVRAAVEASRYGGVVMVSKTIAGKGGCTTMAEGGYNAVLRDRDSVDVHREDTLKGGAYLNDPALVDALVREAPERMTDLVRWGAVFDVTDDRQVAQRPFGGQRFPRTCYAGDRTGHEMIMTLLDRLDATDTHLYQEVSVIDLIKDENDAVAGAIALDRDGDVLLFRADATVLATGGGTQAYDISTNSAAGTGDGFAMAYRAGAELIDMEMIQFHPTGAIYPYDARGRLVTEAVRGEGGILLNARRERFMERYDPDRMELSTRDVVARAIATEVLEGRGTSRGGVYLDVTHLPAETIEARLPVMLEQFLAYGVDIRREPMEVAPTAHHIMGGLRITPECRTTLKGLFACGEVTGGVHGANRLGGNALADTQVFGKRAGEFAGKAPARSGRIDDAAIEEKFRMLDGFFEGAVNPTDVRKDLKLTMWNQAGIFRSAPDLRTALTHIRRLADKRLCAASTANLLECCTVRNMCTTASLIVRCALLRPENRGAHIRLDAEVATDPATSPFSHTYVSLTREGIERREVAA